MTRHAILTLTLLGLLIISAVVGFLIYRGTSPSLSLDSLSVEQTNNLLQDLPPDPGEAGEVTLAGIDSDNDGVRDDIQRWITIKNPHSARVRAALSQAARAFSTTLAPGLTESSAGAISEEMSKALACMEYVYGAPASDAWYDASREIESEFFNTSERWKAYQVYNRIPNDGGASIPLDQQANACSFDVSALPN